MNVFLTKILITTDGSPGSRQAARTAVELSKMFGSELHVVHVFPVRESGDVLGKSFEEASVLREEYAQWAKELLDGQVEKIAEAGGWVDKAHLRCAIGIELRGGDVFRLWPLFSPLVSQDCARN